MKNMQKYIRVTRIDETVWDVPVKLIAEHRANYYASKEGITPKMKQRIYEGELTYAMERDYIILEWYEKHVLDIYPLEHAWIPISEHNEIISWDWLVKGHALLISDKNKKNIWSSGFVPEFKKEIRIVEH